MAYIITVGHNRVKFEISNEDYVWVSMFKWYYSPKKKYIFRLASINGVRKTIVLHQEIMARLSTETGELIDHKDTNRLNNRRDNLRWSTRSKNMQNTNPNKTYKKREKASRFKGVSKRREAWRMTIKLPDGTKIDERHETEEAAARAYDSYASKYFGEFARLNFPGS